MQLAELGRTGIKLSRIALGTMTWGEQNTPDEAFAQMDYALEHGVNFFDTAELYAIPPRAETYGATETIIGRWLSKSSRREEIVLASKVCGPTTWCPHIRGGEARLDAANITAACEASLKRLQTGHLDLYQTHWPDRNTNFFGRLNYHHATDEQMTPPEETLRALQNLVASGKVVHVGVSNEAPWGVMQHLREAETHGLPRIASIQNPYSLLNRSFEIGLAEIACREDVGLLAYSPLAFGVLSGKYLNGQRPQGGRITLFGDRYDRYSNPQAEAATEAYVRLARAHGLNPAQMALAFILRQPFVSSAIIGATTMAQLAQNIAAAEIELSAEVLEGIEAIHQQHPNPCP
ncbi:MAG: NADP(H)-dependent aldo-keto reductase [Mariprofundaceae bacterium]|nr:NADP(H)-dependent aldo-keto reductase [Mariprofundaceae bacterium]